MPSSTYILSGVGFAPGRAQFSKYLARLSAKSEATRGTYPAMGKGEGLLTN